MQQPSLVLSAPLLCWSKVRASKQYLLLLTKTPPPLLPLLCLRFSRVWRMSTPVRVIVNFISRDPKSFVEAATKVRKKGGIEIFFSIQQLYIQYSPILQSCCRQCSWPDWSRAVTSLICCRSWATRQRREPPGQLLMEWFSVLRLAVHLYNCHW